MTNITSQIVIKGVRKFFKHTDSIIYLCISNIFKVIWMHNNLYKPQLKINFIEHAQTLVQSIINVGIKIGYAYC